MEERFENQARNLSVVLVCVFLLLVGRLWQLQIIEKATYRELSMGNAARTIPFIAPRGIIYDRYGKVVVSNRAIFSAYLLPTSVRSSDMGPLLDTLSATLGMQKSEILAKIEKYSSTAFQPVLLKKNLPLSVVTKMEEQRRKYPGVVVRTQPVRRYPNGRAAVHLLGYVGEVAKDELEKMKDQGYKLGDLIGKDGVESTYDKFLRGVDGGQQLEVDVYGQPVRTRQSLDPVAGKDIKLTIDLDLQKVVENTLGQKEGAVVVIDPRNGEVLAMASYPNYDPNVFSEPMDPSEWARLDKGGHPFMNRAISVYPPGSTFKVITLTGALEQHTVTLSETIDCKGSFKLGNRVASCWNHEGHGKLNILEGLVWSCDIVFYELGLRDGVNMMSRYAVDYGLSRKTGVDLPGEADGFIPTAAWKERTLGEPWVKGDSINMGIGQGFIQVTPLQMANLYGGIGEGERFKPHIVMNVFDRDGSTVYSAEAEEIGGNPISSDNLALLRDALRAVVRRGTGIAAKVEGIPAAGKTGTAENPKKAHAWFMCYAPYDKPELAIAAFVAQGEHGDRVTAPMAREILTWHKKNRMARVMEEPDFNWKQYIKHGPFDGKL